MSKSTKILLGIFILSVLIETFASGYFGTPEPLMGASATEIQNHLFFVTIPFALVSLAFLVSGVFLLIRGIKYLVSRTRKQDNQIS